MFRRNNDVEKAGNTLIVEFDEDMKVKNYYFNIPGVDPLDLSLMMHKNKMGTEQQERVAWQNSAVTTKNHWPQIICIYSGCPLDSVCLFKSTG